MHSPTISILFILIGLICFAYLVIRVVRKTVMDSPRYRVPSDVFGDVIEVPAAARNAGGAAQIRSDGLFAQDGSHFHRGDVPTR